MSNLTDADRARIRDYYLERYAGMRFGGKNSENQPYYGEQPEQPELPQQGAGGYQQYYQQWLPQAQGGAELVAEPAKSVEPWSGSSLMALAVFSLPVAAASLIYRRRTASRTV